MPNKKFGIQDNPRNGGRAFYGLSAALVKIKAGWAIGLAAALRCFGIAIPKIVEQFGQDFALVLGIAFLELASGIVGLTFGWSRRPAAAHLYLTGGHGIVVGECLVADGGRDVGSP